jgi:transcriptional regulator with XRE-family HTH domain
MCFAERLKDLREQCHITQVALQVRLSLSTDRISEFERCKRWPSIVEARALAKYFRVSPAWLAWGVGAMNDEASNDG